MLFVELHGDFETEEEVLEAIQELVSRLVVDESGEVIGVLDEDDLDSEVTVKVPEHIIAWAKKEPQ